MTTPLAAARLRRRSAQGLLALCAVVAATACGLTPNARNPFDGSAEQAVADRLRIQIRNLNFNDVTVFVVSSGQRVRLGGVTGKTDEDFRLEWNTAVPLWFEVDVIGGRGCRTQELTVDPGARIWVQIPTTTGAAPCRVGRG